MTQREYDERLYRERDVCSARNTQQVNHLPTGTRCGILVESNSN
jgi:hypothetical protein